MNNEDIQKLDDCAVGETVTVTVTYERVDELEQKRNETRTHST